MAGKKIGYIRVSTIDQQHARQLEGVKLDKRFIDKASGKTTQRPQLDALLSYAREGDTVMVHSMDRLARNVVDLRHIVKQLTSQHISIEFRQEGLVFTGEDNPMSLLLLSVMGAFSEFERSLIKERQLEGITLAKQRGAYRGRKPKLTLQQKNELKRRVENGESKSHVANDFSISRGTLYQYLKD